MAKKLSEDEIKWILSVESSEAQQNIRKLTKENKELEKQNKQHLKSMDKLVAEGKKESAAYKNLKKSMEDNRIQMGKNRQAMNMLTDRMNVSQLTMGQLRKRARDLRSQLEQTSKATHPEEYAKLQRELSHTRQRMNELDESGKRLKSTFSATNIAKGAMLAGVAAFIASVKDGVKILKDFEAANSDLAAIMLKSRKEIVLLTDDAKRLGAATRYTASEVTLLQTELAKLGFNQQQILDMTASVLAFAEATGADLPRAAALAGSAMGMFGLTTKDTDRIVSVLGVSTTKSALNFSYLESALSTVGPVAKSFGFTIEDTVAMLGTLADAGFDASSAATATRNILLNLADSSGKLAKALGGPIKNFDELIPGLMILNSQGVDLATTLELTDKRSVAAFNTFLAGAEKAQVLRDSVTDCNEALKFMQEERLNNLQGSLAILSSSWEGLLLKFESTNGVAKIVVDWLSEFINNMGKAVDWTSQYGKEIKAVLVALGTYIGVVKTANFLKRQYTIVTGQAIAATKLESMVAKASVAWITIKNTLLQVLTRKITLATAAQRLWNAVTSAHPLILLGSALVGAISYMTIFKERTDDATYSQKQLADSLDDTKAAIDRMNGIRLKDANRDKLNKRQLQELRAQSVQELKVKEDQIVEETAMMEAAQAAKLELLEDEEKMKDSKNRKEAARLQTMEQNYRKSISNAKGESEELKAIIESIPEQKFTLTPDDKSDLKAAALKNQESAHNEEINAIKLAGQEKQKTQDEINAEILASDEVYYQKRIKTLEGFIKSEKKESKKAEYNKQLVDSKTKLLNTEMEIDKQKIAALEKTRTKELAVEELTTKQIRIQHKQRLANKEISQEEYNTLSLSLDQNSVDMRLAIEERFLNDVNELELNNGNLKAEAIDKANKLVLDAEGKAVDARAAIQVKLDDMLKDFKGQFKLTTVGEDLQAQQKVLEDVYKARKELAQKNNLDTTELDAAYLRAREQLIQESENRINQIRSQYGLLTLQEDYDLELQQLNTHLEQEYLTQEEYEKAVQNLKRDSYKKQFDYYKDIFSNAFESLQQAELDMVDAKYDVQIEAAKGNAEEVERLENEKAQKKLDIEKKYADVNFAIKASQIIADTAVGIMRAFADLGPIGGAIAAALLGVTGVAQLASANAERKKVKSMTLSGSGSGSGTGARVATGREQGGKIDIIREQDGKFFPGADYDPDARGFIDKPTVIVGEGAQGQSKEWVASNAAVENETIAPILQIMDQHQKAGDIATVDMNQILRQKMAAGYVSGGSISTPIPTKEIKQTFSDGPTHSDQVLEKLTVVLNSIEKNGISADVLLSDLDRKSKLRDQARSIGSK